MMNGISRDVGHNIAVMIDSGGLKTTERGGWLTSKRKEKGRRGWIRVHVAIDKDTMSNVGSFSVTKQNRSGHMEFKNVFDPIIGEVIKVCGDKGYGGGENFNCVASNNVAPICCQEGMRERARGSPARAKVVREINKMGLENWKKPVEHIIRRRESRNILFSIEKNYGGGSKSKKDNISIPRGCNEYLLLLYSKKKHGGELRNLPSQINCFFS